MQTCELDAYLGGTIATEDQRAALRAALDRVSQRYPEQGDTDATTAASTAAQVVLGDATLAGVASAYLATRAIERERWAALVGAMIGAAASGVPEVRIAETTGVARMTVRKALGK